MPSDSERLQAYEDDFRQAGLPLFSEDISPYEDVFNRAAPLLGVVLLGELLGAGQLDWTWWQNVLAVLGGLAILLTAVAIGNRARGPAVEQRFPNGWARPSSPDSSWSLPCSR